MRKSGWFLCNLLLWCVKGLRRGQQALTLHQADNSSVTHLQCSSFLSSLCAVPFNFMTHASSQVLLWKCPPVQPCRWGVMSLIKDYHYPWAVFLLDAPSRPCSAIEKLSDTYQPAAVSHSHQSRGKVTGNWILAWLMIWFSSSTFFLLKRQVKDKGDCYVAHSKLRCEWFWRGEKEMERDMWMSWFVFMTNKNDKALDGLHEGGDLVGTTKHVTMREAKKWMSPRPTKSEKILLKGFITKKWRKEQRSVQRKTCY